MQDDRAHSLLQQTPLAVNPFIDLPKAPTLPHNYASLPSTLPGSILNAPPAPSNADLAAYVTSSSGFAAHPSTIIAQNKALLEQMQRQQEEGLRETKRWETAIRDRELSEKRRKAPGWLDSEARLLEPEKPKVEESGASLLDTPAIRSEMSAVASEQLRGKDVDDLGAAMDRAFGRSEMD